MLIRNKEDQQNNFQASCESEENGEVLLLDPARKLYSCYEDVKSGQSNYSLYNETLLYVMGEKSDEQMIVGLKISET